MNCLKPKSTHLKARITESHNVKHLIQCDNYCGDSSQHNYLTKALLEAKKKSSDKATNNNIAH